MTTHLYGEVPTKLKRFKWNDKTGRGFKATFHLSDILSDDDKENDCGLEGDLHQWAQDAEIGDVWECSTDRYERTR